MRANPRRAPLQVLLETGLERLHRRRLAGITQLSGAEAELLGTFGETWPERRDRVAASRDQRARQLGNPRRPRRERVARGGAECNPAERSIALPYGRGVFGRQQRPRREQPPEDTVEVRAPHGRAALDDRQPVRREDESRQLGPELLGGAQRSAVQLGT